MFPFTTVFLPPQSYAFRLTGVVNPVTVGPYPVPVLETRKADGSVVNIDLTATGQTVEIVSVAPLASGVLLGSTTRAGAVADVTVRFASSVTVGDAPSLVLTFPAAFDVTQVLDATSPTLGALNTGAISVGTRGGGKG